MFLMFWVSLTLVILTLKTDYTVRDYKVLDKYGKQASHYKSTDIHTEYILILRNPVNKVIDVEVSPSTYWSYKKGDVIRFSFSSKRSGIKEDDWITENRNTIGVLSLFSIVICLAVYIATFID